MEKAQYRIACMQSAFPEAMIEGYERLVDVMPNDPKDRHVLAAAVCGRADAIITENLKDFPTECLQCFGIERLTPDDFLVHQWHLDPRLVKRRLQEIVTEYHFEWNGHLDILAQMVPVFVEFVRHPDRPNDDTK